jgi:hypothetical protein
MAYRYRDNDPRQAVENYASWIDALHSEGLSVLSVVFQFNQLPGSQLSKIAQMQREIETVVDMVTRRMDKVLYPNRSSDLISFFKITPDYPVPKKKKKPIREVTINDGLHMNADVPHSPSITNLLVELLKEYQRLYVTPWSAIRSIYPNGVETYSKSVELNTI